MELHSQLFPSAATIPRIQAKKWQSQQRRTAFNKTLLDIVPRVIASIKDNLTLFPPKTNIFVHSKNCTFSKKGLGHKGRCYSVCNDDTCKWTSHILSRIIGPSNTATKIGVPISDTGHMAQISTANPEILINFHACSCKVYSCSCKIYSCSHKIHAFPCKFMRIHAKFICVHVNFFCVHVNFMHEYLKYQL